MKLAIMMLSLLLLTGCGSGAADSLFRIIPNSNNVCPHGQDPMTNECNS